MAILSLFGLWEGKQLQGSQVQMLDLRELMGFLFSIFRYKTPPAQRMCPQSSEITQGNF